MDRSLLMDMVINGGLFLGGFIVIMLSKNFLIRWLTAPLSGIFFIFLLSNIGGLDKAYLFFADIISFVALWLLASMGIGLNYKFSDAVRLYGIALSNSDHSEEALSESKAFLESLKQVVLYCSLMVLVLGLVLTFTNLEDVHQVGMNVGVSLIAPLYGAIFNFFFVIPLIGRLDKKIAAKTESAAK